jgi:hypothetical protein
MDTRLKDFLLCQIVVLLFDLLQFQKIFYVKIFIILIIIYLEFLLKLLLNLLKVKIVETFFCIANLAKHWRLLNLHIGNIVIILNLDVDRLFIAPLKRSFRLGFL